MRIQSSKKSRLSISHGSDEDTNSVDKTYRTICLSVIGVIRRLRGLRSTPHKKYVKLFSGTAFITTNKNNIKYVRQAQGQVV